MTEDKVTPRKQAAAARKGTKRMADGNTAEAAASTKLMCLSTEVRDLKKKHRNLRSTVIVVNDWRL